MATKYRGELGKKLPPRQHAKKLAAALREDKEALANLVRKELELQTAKLPALFEHFEIEYTLDYDDAIYLLALALAEAHVPGFQFEQARGAPKKWSFEKRIKAAASLGKLGTEFPGKSQNALAAIMHKREPWKSLSRTPASLLKQIRFLNIEQVAVNGISGKIGTGNILKDLLSRN